MEVSDDNDLTQAPKQGPGLLGLITKVTSSKDRTCKGVGLF